MPDNMVELKKDALSQKQSGDWKASFNLQAIDMPDYLLTAPMGKRFYVVFVDADDYDEREGKPVVTKVFTEAERKELDASIRPGSIVRVEQTEGEKLRTRAVMLCKNSLFWEYCGDVGYANIINEENAKQALYDILDINSRAWLRNDIPAQNRFKQLLQEYETWLLEQQYSDNLNR